MSSSDADTTPAPAPVPAATGGASGSGRSTPSGGPRLIGPDVVRALAMAGVVVMNYHGYLILRGGERGGSALADLLDPWTGPFSTRFAATFVLVAGVGVATMSASAAAATARGDEAKARATWSTVRWRLASRGILLYLFGLGFDVIWSGSILPYYGALFVLAAALVTVRSRWLLALAGAATLAAWGLRAWRFEREAAGHDTRWITDPGPRSIRGPLFDLVVNGTHPLLPWLAFFCVGMVVGRLVVDPRAAAWWRPAVVGAGIVSWAIASLSHELLTAGARTDAGSFVGVDDARVVLRWSLDPFDRGVLYTASALGTALVAFGLVTWLADRFAGTGPVRVLAEVGRVSLSVYVAHALVFNLVVDWLGWVRPAGVVTALVFAFAVWVGSAAAAIAWRRRFGQGPFEYAYRRLTV